MAYAGTQTVSQNKYGQVIINTAGLDADAEVGGVVDMYDYIASSWGSSPRNKEFVPQYANLRVTATHASEVTDTVSVKLQGSVDGVNYDDLRYFRNNCITVGAGNTLTAIAEIW